MSTTLKSLAVFLGMLCLHSNEASASNPHQFIDLQAQEMVSIIRNNQELYYNCLLYTSPSPRDVEESRMPSSA